MAWHCNYLALWAKKLVKSEERESGRHERDTKRRMNTKAKRKDHFESYKQSQT